MKFIQNVLKAGIKDLGLYSQPKYPTRDQRMRELIKREAAVGSLVFGPVPAGRQREFFMLDASTWIWFEEWQTEYGRQSTTTRYEIHGAKIFKYQNDQPATQLVGAELANFSYAVKTYHDRVAVQVYGYVQQTA